MAGVGLKHRRAQLDGGRRPTRQRHGGQGVAAHGAGVPEAGEAFGLGPLGLLDHPLDGRGPTAQPDSHGDRPYLPTWANPPGRSSSDEWLIGAPDELVDDVGRRREELGISYLIVLEARWGRSPRLSPSSLAPDCGDPSCCRSAFGDGGVQSSGVMTTLCGLVVVRSPLLVQLASRSISTPSDPKSFARHSAISWVVSRSFG